MLHYEVRYILRVCKYKVYPNASSNTRRCKRITSIYPVIARFYITNIVCSSKMFTKYSTQILLPLDGIFSRIIELLTSRIHIPGVVQISTNTLGVSSGKSCSRQLTQARNEAKI